MAASCHILLPGIEGLESGERLAGIGQRRAIPMRGPAHAFSFLSFVHLACAFVWLA
jgi:hypothetical protein